MSSASAVKRQRILPDLTVRTNPAAIVCVKCGSIDKGSCGSGGILDGGTVQPSDPPKDPAIMCILSVLIVGLGQIILGQTAKGITMLNECVIILTAGTCCYGLLLAPDHLGHFWS